MKRLLLFAPVLISLLAANIGCQSANMGMLGKTPMKLFSKKDVEEEKPNAVRMAVIWKDAVYEDVGTPKTRGMGGRIYFYDDKNKPVQAFGELIVYGFDDTRANPDKKPKKFMFPEEDFQNYLSKSDLGDSYSVWIPWDEVGGIRKAISLIPIFKTTDGRILKSGQTLCTLPGRAPDPSEFESIDDRDPHVKTFHNNLYGATQAGGKGSNGSFVKQASAVDHEKLINEVGSRSATVSYKTRTENVRATTINLTKSMADRIKRLPPQETTTPKVKPKDSKMEDLDKKLNEHKTMMENHFKQVRRKESEAKSKENSKPNSIGVPSIGNPNLSRVRSDLIRKQTTVTKFPTQRPVFGKPGDFN